MSTKRSVVLKGDPVYNEDGVAVTTLRPGWLVKGVSYIDVAADGDTPMPRAFVVEREELGQGLDNARQGSGTISAYYASGDTVKVAVCGPGDVVTAFIASGETVNEDTLLTSNGDGLLEAYSASDYVIGRSLDNLGTVAVATACRVEIV